MLCSTEELINLWIGEKERESERDFIASAVYMYYGIVNSELQLHLPYLGLLVNVTYKLMTNTDGWKMLNRLTTITVSRRRRERFNSRLQMRSF